MSSSELLAARPFPLARGLVLRNRMVGTAHAAGFVSGGLAQPEEPATGGAVPPAAPRCWWSAAR